MERERQRQRRIPRPKKQHRERDAVPISLLGMIHDTPYTISNNKHPRPDAPPQADILILQYLPARTGPRRRGGPTAYEAYTAPHNARNAINYPERGRMRSRPGQRWQRGDEEPQWRCCISSKGGDSRRTRPGLCSRNLSSAQGEVCCAAARVRIARITPGSCSLGG